jgi:glycosyltransferase involved in cell wall biosynthesis
MALESLASGTPIIMSDLPATSWFLEEITEAKQGTGLKFEPNNSVDLAFKIKKMYKLWLNNEGLYRKSVVKSRRVAELFSVDRMVPEYLKLFFMIHHRDSND